MGIKKLLVAGVSAGVVMSVASVASMADSYGWREEDGSWRFYTSDTEYVKEDWVKNNGKWYYFDEDGFYVANTWAAIDGDLYYFDANGAMATDRWINCDEVYADQYIYYTYNDTVDWRYVGSNGVAYTGWHKINGQWYYFNESNYSGEDKYIYIGLMRYGNYYDEDGHMYHFDENGHYISNTWYQDEYETWYYFGPDGIAYTGWHQINGKWYFFGDNAYYDECFMRTGRVETYNDKYEVWVLDENGALQTGWSNFKYYEYDEETDDYIWKGKYNWYYSGSDGSCYHSQWLYYNGSWYYFKTSGVMVADIQEFYIDGKLYSFDKSGRCTNADNPKIVNGWYLIKYGASEHYFYDDRWVYVDNGKEYRDQWLNYNGAWYYLAVARGYKDWPLYSYMMCDVEDIEINGKYYDFDADGKCLNPDAIKITGWIQEEGEWYYYGDDGIKYTEQWLNYNNKWYYFNWYGAMVTDDYYYVSDDENDTLECYYFNEKGEMITGWIPNGTRWMYAGPDGVLYRNDKWLNYNGNWYFFRTRNMVFNVKDYEIDGKYYDFDENGKCLNPYNGRTNKLIIIMGSYFS